ncbi:uncharacterized protein LOC135131524 [Zophobas morio]|uniref:uncharacterized protein LOC135131524 n=1 Tax=Zophobas morio TaxID=2755281 RepID=UPI003083B2DC
MLKKSVLLLLAVVTIAQATYIAPPNYASKTCFGYSCPPATVNCKKHIQTEGDYRVHIDVYCLDYYGTTLHTTTYHDRNRRPGFRFHKDLYAVPEGTGCSECDYGDFDY